MKLLSAIKKAVKKAEERQDDSEFCVRRKNGLAKEINRIRYYDIRVYTEDAISINIDCSFEDLSAKDWVVEESE